MNRLTLALIGASLVLAGLLYYSWSSGIKKQAEITALKDTLQGVAKARERDSKVLAARSKEKAALARELLAAHRKLEGALKQHGDWADQPVPKEVQDALDD